MKRQSTSQVYTVSVDDGIVYVQFDEESTIDVLKEAIQAVNDIQNHDLRYWDFTKVDLFHLSVQQLNTIANLPAADDIIDYGAEFFWPIQTAGKSLK